VTCRSSPFTCPEKGKGGDKIDGEGDGLGSENGISIKKVRPDREMLPLSFMRGKEAVRP